jgi:hypothetical protein
MVKDAKTWYWCDFHGYWCEHETKDCRAKKKKAEGTHADDKTVKRRNGGQTPTNTQSLSIARALLAISERDEDLSNDDL